MTTNAIKGLVLAGGRSRRMGSDKALMTREGKSQLERAVELLQKYLPEVFVSARAEQSSDEERSRYPLVIDQYDGIGPIAGVLSAMDEDRLSSWLVLACDLPNIDGETIAKLLEFYSGQHPFIAYKSSHDGLPEPLCAIFTPASRPIIDGFVADGMVCPRKMLIRSNTLLLEQPNPEALDNMNTPDDLIGTGVRIAR